MGRAQTDLPEVLGALSVPTLTALVNAHQLGPCPLPWVVLAPGRSLCPGLPPPLLVMHPGNEHQRWR